jgi:hypothetical protein
MVFAPLKLNVLPFSSLYSIMSAKKPRSKKQKGKRFEEQVSELIHQIALAKISKYSSEVAENEKIKPHRDYSSGTFKNNPCDIELNYLQKYLPFCIECKHWTEFKNYSIFDLFKSKSKFITTLYRIYNEKNSKHDIGNLTRLVVFKSDRTPILVFFSENDFSNDFLDRLTFLFRTRIISDNKLTKSSFCIALFEEFINLYINIYVLGRE